MEQLSFDDLSEDPASPKRCERCGEMRSLAEFPADGRCADGHRKLCQSCDFAVRARTAQAYYARKADFRKIRKRARASHASLRTRVFNHYGWSCACCGIVPARPEIDHVDGNGRAHRAEVGRGAGVWLWLIKNRFPEGFQTLCGNCNRAKGATDTCPLDHG